MCSDRKMLQPANCGTARRSLCLGPQSCHLSLESSNMQAVRCAATAVNVAVVVASFVLELLNNAKHRQPSAAWRSTDILTYCNLRHVCFHATGPPQLQGVGCLSPGRTDFHASTQLFCRKLRAADFGASQDLPGLSSPARQI